jgi:hypothetical protein
MDDDKSLAQAKATGNLARPFSGVLPHGMTTKFNDDHVE